MRAISTIAIVLFCALPINAQTPPTNGEGDFEYLSPYSNRLMSCVLEKHRSSGKIGACKGVVKKACTEDTGNALNCASEEQFAWDDILRATLPILIGVADGKTQISNEAYIAALNERYMSGRAPCFEITADQIERQIECQINATIADVIWHFELFDNGI